MNIQAMDKLLQENGILISDGATGSNLIARGLPRGETAEHWVLHNPDEIQKLHSGFIKNGANIILTSTFGASSPRLKHAGLGDKVKDVNTQAVEIAKRAADGLDTLVAGSMGPLGEMLKPLGLLEVADAAEAYREQAKALVDAGVDLLVIETQFDLTEATTAVEAVRSFSDIALVCSFSFDRGTKTMMGISPESFAAAMGKYDLWALGINCGKSLDDNLQCLQELRERTGRPIWFKPNAGLPELDGEGNAVYSLTPQEMGLSAAEWANQGAKIIGGCCGTSPAHLSEIAKNKP